MVVTQVDTDAPRVIAVAKCVKCARECETILYVPGDVPLWRDMHCDHCQKATLHIIESETVRSYTPRTTDDFDDDDSQDTMMPYFKDQTDPDIYDLFDDNQEV